ncbi:MAG: sulfurtransferase TusA family protein [Gammaproteobacteria bacterium]|nr:sulfurtransferase TusA family protein [Gammaproteobacteria bacterium]
MSAEAQLTVQQELDLRGLNCPLPILRTKQALRSMEVGQCVRVVATDPHSVIDFMGFCDTTEHELLAHEQAEGEFTFTIRKGARPA